VFSNPGTKRPADGARRRPCGRRRDCGRQHQYLLFLRNVQAATPLVSSAVAPDARRQTRISAYRDVQEILAISAKFAGFYGNSAANGYDGFKRRAASCFDPRRRLRHARRKCRGGAGGATGRTPRPFANEKELDFSFTPTANLDPTHSALTYNFTPAKRPRSSRPGYVEIDLAISDADLKGSADRPDFAPTVPTPNWLKI